MLHLDNADVRVGSFQLVWPQDVQTCLDTIQIHTGGIMWTQLEFTMWTQHFLEIAWLSHF